ncbi:hypothetical protein N9L40_01535 [Rhodobacteraceae bacterium]|nr:hypothetical protein [Paracoccaceae bacterium]
MIAIALGADANPALNMPKLCPNFQALSFEHPVGAKYMSFFWDGFSHYLARLNPKIARLFLL